MNSRVLALVATVVLCACAGESIESEQAPLGAVPDKGMYGPDVSWEVYQEDVGDGPVLRVIGVASAGPIGAEAALRQRDGVTELLATSASGSWTTGWTEDGQVSFEPEPPAAETLALLETLQRSFDLAPFREPPGPTRPSAFQVFRI